jgi:drug/metabolite transporter (DMT)-like permease
VSDRLVGAAFVMFAAAAFSVKAILVKLAYRHGVDAVTLLTLRMLFSAPFFLLIAWWWGRDGALSKLTRREWAAVAALGLLGYYLASLFDFLGLQYITAALERLVLYLYPTFVVLIAAAFQGRRIRRSDLVALGLSYFGIALVVANDVAIGHRNVALGAFWVFLSAICYAIYLVGNGRMVKRMSPVLFACVASLFSCLGVFAHHLAVSDVALVWSQSAPVYGYAFLMATLSTVLPIIVMSEGIRRIGASHSAMLGAVGPVVTIALAAMLLGEAVTVRQVLGAALVMAGVLAISLAKPTATTPTPAAR